MKSSFRILSMLNLNVVTVSRVVNLLYTLQIMIEFSNLCVDVWTTGLSQAESKKKWSASSR
jgi:hypothetical protein